MTAQEITDVDADFRAIIAELERCKAIIRGLRVRLAVILSDVSQLE